MTTLAHRNVGGHGDPFVLVHGYTGSSDDFLHVVEPLREHAEVTLVDQLGHGGSPRVASYTYEALTAAIVEFLDDHFDQPVHLLGHSMGGRTVLPIATGRPDLVRSLILMDTWADEPDREPDTDFFLETMALPQDQALAALDHHWSEPGPEDLRIVERWGAQWAEAHWGFNNDHVDPAAKYQLGRLVFMPSTGVLDQCGDITCPTTILCGRYDVPFLGASERMAATIPDALLHIIEGAYHSPQLTHPEEWTAVIVRHLERAS